MAQGLIEHLDIQTTGSLLQFYQVPLNVNASVTLRFTNRNASNVKVRIAISDTVSPDNSYFILYDQTIYPNDVYTESVIVLAAQQYIFVQSDTANVSAVLFGFVE